MSEKKNQSKSLATHLLAGGGAGLVESCLCHPLDTIKVRMQLKGRIKTMPSTGLAPVKLGPLGTAVSIVKNEGALALYKGLGAVVSAIVPKMAIRFSSFEWYKRFLQDADGKVSTTGTFVAGLGAGITESILVVNPMEVVKIRLQAQRHSLADPADVPKYRSAGHALYTIVKEEGIIALYKGVSLTAARQATNQAVNFTLYQEFKRTLMRLQDTDSLPSWQHLLAGGISGAIAPMANAPIDTVKTRIQKQVSIPGESGLTRIKNCVVGIIQKEGFLSFYNGLTPRLLRIAPGQAITFMVYEKIQSWMSHSWFTTTEAAESADQ